MTLGLFVKDGRVKKKEGKKDRQAVPVYPYACLPRARGFPLSLSLSRAPSRKMRWQKAKPKASSVRVQAEQAFIHDSRQHGKSLDPRDIHGQYKVKRIVEDGRPCLQTPPGRAIPYSAHRNPIPIYASHSQF